MVKMEIPQYECPGCKRVATFVSDKCPLCGFDFTKQKPKKVEDKGKFQTGMMEP